MTNIKLVNCPICGVRTSADKISCPECDFEIKKYFEYKIETKTLPKRFKSIYIISAAILIIIMLLAVFLIIRFNSQSDTQTQTSLNILSNENADITPNTQPAISDISNETLLLTDYTGVYSGDDAETLVLDKDGLAYYYCSDIQFTELKCPWYIKADKICIDFCRLHCTVYADINTMPNKLIFESDSINWTAEEFTRLDVTPEDYLTRALSCNDPHAVQNPDGTLSYTLNQITYTLPKSFRDADDDMDSIDNYSVFLDTNAQANYTANILFYSEPKGFLPAEISEKNTAEFASKFYNNVEIKSQSSIVIADNTAMLYEINGYLNKNFYTLQNLACEGYIAIFTNTNSGTVDYICLMQNSHRTNDQMTSFINILKSAD